MVVAEWTRMSTETFCSDDLPVPYLQKALYNCNGASEPEPLVVTESGFARVFLFLTHGM